MALLAVPGAAQTIYSSGPTNGNWYAWTINFGFIVSDAFTTPYTTLDGATFAMWLFPGDTLTSAELSITSGENGGTSYFDQTVNFTQGSCAANSYGYNVCTESAMFNGPVLNSGTYWLNLQNASVPSGDPVYWDQNLGPHVNLDSAWENTVGSIPAETFTLLGEMTCGPGSNCSQSQPETAPEPGSISLIGGGGMAILGFLGALRRKLF
jgi:hypothetical protein